MRPTLPRLAAALPDAISAGFFLTTWIAPTVTGPAAVAQLSQVMLMEFLVVHSSIFYALLAAAGSVARGMRLAWLTGLSSFYLLFALGFALANHSTWPLFAFGWLFASRFIHIWTRPVQSDAESLRSVRLWAVSVASYVVGAMATILVPLPPLGMTPELVASLHLAGSGQWVSRPWTVLAFGAVYFSIQAFAKYAVAGSVPARKSPSAHAARVIETASATTTREA